MTMKYIENAQSQSIATLGVDGVNAFLQDTISSNNPDAPISCGFFRMESGAPLEYTYEFEECKIMLEGEMTLAEKNGMTVTLKPGDVVYFGKNTTITFTSESVGLAFYVGQRKEGDV